MREGWRRLGLLLLLALVAVASVALLSVLVVEVAVSDGGEAIADCGDSSFFIPTEERDLLIARRIDG